MSASQTSTPIRQFARTFMYSRSHHQSSRFFIKRKQPGRLLQKQAMKMMTSPPLFLLSIALLSTIITPLQAFSSSLLSSSSRPRRPTLHSAAITKEATIQPAGDRQQRKQSRRQQLETSFVEDMTKKRQQRQRRKKSSSSPSSSSSDDNLSTTTTQRDQYSQRAMVQHDILSRTEELKLGQQVQRARQIQGKIHEIASEQQQQQQQDNTSILSNIHIQNSNTAAAAAAHVHDKLNQHSSQIPQLQRTTLKSSDDKLILWNDRIIDDLSDHDIISQLQIPGGRVELRRTLRLGSKARQTLITNNIRLVVSIAKQLAKSGANTFISYHANYISNRPSLDEVVQEGILGLVKAVERYDPSVQVRFSTYATYWITSYIRRCYHQSTTGCLNVPIYLHHLAQQCKSLVKQHYQLRSTPPTLEHVAREMSLSPNRLRKILASTRPLASLDAPAFNAGGNGGGGGRTTRDRARGDQYSMILEQKLACSEPRPEEQVERSLLRQCLENAMAAELSPHERDVVRLRLGLDDGVSRTMRQVASVLSGGDSLTVPEIKAAEQRALKKLRSPYSLHTHKLLWYLDL